MRMNRVVCRYCDKKIHQSVEPSTQTGGLNIHIAISTWTWARRFSVSARQSPCLSRTSPGPGKIIIRPDLVRIVLLSGVLTSNNMEQ